MCYGWRASITVESESTVTMFTRFHEFACLHEPHAFACLLASRPALKSISLRGLLSLPLPIRAETKSGLAYQSKRTRFTLEEDARLVNLKKKERWSWNTIEVQLPRKDSSDAEGALFHEIEVQRLRANTRR
jgi:hypothetical protein